MVALTEADYPRILRTLITKYNAELPSVGEVVSEAIIDETLGHYQVVRSGWVNESRIHGSLLHIDIKNGKIWIQHDGTYEGVANELVAAGVPKEKIVLAYKSPAMRPYTEYAVN